MKRRLMKAAAAALIVLAGMTAVTSDVLAQERSLYDDLGGRAGVEAIVRDAVGRWLKNPLIASSFDGTDLKRLHTQLHDQFCALAGGGCVYKGRDMKRAHEGLEVRMAQFNALAEDLQRAMDAQGVPFRTQNRLIALLAPMQRDIVTH